MAPGPEPSLLYAARRRACAVSDVKITTERIGRPLIAPLSLIPGAVLKGIKSGGLSPFDSWSEWQDHF